MVKIAALFFLNGMVACIMRNVEVAVGIVRKIVAWRMIVAVVAGIADRHPEMVVKIAILWHEYLIVMLH